MDIVLVGPGRAGHALRDRALARGHHVRLVRDPATAADAEVVLVTVPDATIGAVARAVPPGPWLGHVSGATPLAELGPGGRRFVLHPAQSLERDGGAVQLDGASAFVTGADADALAFATMLADALGLRPVPLAEAERPLPHVACVLAANALVALLATACRLLGRPDALEILAPLATRALANAIAAGPQMQPTGPVSRGDAVTIERHLRALDTADPAVAALYRAVCRATLPIVDPGAAARVAPLL
jgi:predicted short-subunit dehydrogenase-like oxidoreductase (DUF2520 family)